MAEKLKTFKKALTAETLAHRVIVWWLPLLYLLISSLFYLRTYDSAQVKITIMQMGGAALLAFWIIRLFEAGKSAFNRQDLVTLSPFLAYLFVGIYSFLHAPYHMASVDFFLRHVFFMVAALIVIYEFDQPAAERLTRILIWTGWIAVGYGFLQWVDMMLTSYGYLRSGPGNGLDPFIWRGAFGLRIFSTYGNPNFYGDFLVILFPILLMRHIQNRNFMHLPLMGMLLVTLIATGTKGAWLGFALVLLLLGVAAFKYFSDQVAPYKKIIITTVSLGVLLFLGVVAKDLRTRVVSVNFRLFTWEATWEMIRTQPLIGTGVGSFPPIYPAFRRPPIFHIEGKHNTETDHAENEYIEQLFDNGIIGFGIFLWLIFSTVIVGMRALEQLTGPLRLKDGRPHPRAYELIGYMISFLGMLGHNFFDVSMRFVSSGVYLGLLSGMIVNLSRGQGLYELHGQTPALGQGGPGPAPEPAAAQASWKTTLSEFVIWPARLAAWIGLLWLSTTIIKEFNLLQGPLQRLNLGGEVLQWWLAWSVLLGCVVSLSLMFVRLTYLSQKPVVSLIVLAMTYPIHLFWGYFKADVHHNIAIYHSKERRWDEALLNYRIVHDLNPNFVMSLYFTGNVFNDRFNMEKVENPKWGDPKGVARDDYQRALAAYDGVRRLAPNYVQMHHQVGALHMKRAEWAFNHNQPDEAQKYLDLALNRFRLYEQIDPVFGPNYFRMAQVYMIRKQWPEAIKAYEDYINAPKCEVAPSLLSKEWLRSTILSYQPYRLEPGTPEYVHRHETAEAYTNLANAYFMAERLPEAEAAYKKALALDANFEQAKRNLSVTYNKAQQLGRLRKTTATSTGYEIIPPKK